MDPMHIAILSSMAGAVAIMWRALANESKKLSRRADQCERDREIIRTKLSSLERRVGIFEACPTTVCGARSAIQRMKAFGSDTKKLS